MKNSIILSLIAGGFLRINDTKYAKGYGSIANGQMCTVELFGETARITDERWFWDGADEEWETTETCEVYLGRVWEHLPAYALRA
jgi:hypothetical protein